MKIKTKHQVKPGITGTIACSNGHERLVKDLNPERIAVLCPVCGDYYSINKALKK